MDLLSDMSELCSESLEGEDDEKDCLLGSNSKDIRSKTFEFLRGTTEVFAKPISEDKQLGAENFFPFSSEEYDAFEDLTILPSITLSGDDEEDKDGVSECLLRSETIHSLIDASGFFTKHLSGEENSEEFAVDLPFRSKSTDTFDDASEFFPKPLSGEDDSVDTEVDPPFPSKSTDTFGDVSGFFPKTLSGKEDSDNNEEALPNRSEPADSGNNASGFSSKPLSGDKDSEYSDGDPRFRSSALECLSISLSGEEDMGDNEGDRTFRSEAFDNRGDSTGMFSNTLSGDADSETDL